MKKHIRKIKKVAPNDRCLISDSPATSLTIKIADHIWIPSVQECLISDGSKCAHASQVEYIHLKQHEYYTERFIFIFDEQFVQVYDYCAAI